MSKEFIELAVNKSSINEASLQEDQLLYFTTSKLQDNRVDITYLAAWAERKFQTNDYFLNWVKTIFKTDNFLTFFKYLRYPIPSTKIIHNRIEPQLRRVFNAEDSDFKYDVQGKTTADFIQELDIKHFNKEIFENLLYYHNGLLVTELDSTISNQPFRFFLDINRVVSLKHNNRTVIKIAYKASIIFEEQKVDGIIVIDSAKYAFFDNDRKLITETPHDLGYTPVHFISPSTFKNDFIIRESIFTYVREELEEYVFLKTLLKMTEVNGAIPVTVMIEAEVQTEDIKGKEGEPSSDTIMGSQRSLIFNQSADLGGGDLQPGTVHKMPLKSIQDAEGKINTDAVKNYLNFFFIPRDQLDYIVERIKNIEISIISTIVGDVLESSEASKNEDQIAKSISILENTLTSFAESLNRIRKLSDTDMLSLQFGKDMVKGIFIHYGTDFFLDSQTKLFKDLANAPNTLERKNIIVRISKNRYKNNIDMLSRQTLLYDLIPYVSDKDFEAAGDIDVLLRDYQLRFNYWISQFEALFGDIVVFFKELEGTQSEKLILINNLITQLIKENGNSNSLKNG